MKAKSKLINELRGSTKDRTGNIKYSTRTTKPNKIVISVPPEKKKTHSDAQDAARARFAHFARVWSELSAAQQDKYSKEAAKLKLTAYDFFMSEQLKLRHYSERYFDHAMLSHTYPSNNYFCTNEIIISTETPAYPFYAGRAIYKVRLPVLQSHFLISSAIMQSVISDTSFFSTPGSMLEIHNINENYNIETVTWNTQPSFDEEIIDEIAITQQYRQVLDFDVREEIEKIASGEHVFRGWMLKAKNDLNAAGEDYAMMGEYYNFFLGSTGLKMNYWGKKLL
jgi:hypothetical protein